MTWISQHFSSIPTLGVRKFLLWDYSKIWHTDAVAPWLPTGAKKWHYLYLAHRCSSSLATHGCLKSGILRQFAFPVWILFHYLISLINWVRGQCRNILSAAFSVLTDRPYCLTYKSQQLHWKNRPHITKLASWIFMWPHFHFAGPWRLNCIFHES